MKPILSTHLMEFFESSTISMFEYDINKNQITRQKTPIEQNDYHTKLFIELQMITDMLNELNCDYSVDEQGNILL